MNVDDKLELELRRDNPEETYQFLRNWYLYFFGILGCVTIVNFVFNPDRVEVLLGILLLGTGMYVAGTLVEEYSELQKRHERGRISEEKIVVAIQEAFKDQNVQVHHRVQIGEKQDLDIFVRFPETKTMFAISVKNWGVGKVVFHEQRNLLCFRQQNRGLRYLSDPDVLEELREHELWLRKNNRAIFGGSSRDAKRPVRKVLVFAEPTKIQIHHDYNYTIIGDRRFLKVERDRSTILVLAEEELIDFIRVCVLESNKSNQEEDKLQPLSA